MITPGAGNLLEADVEALVNTVNCVGVMGKGIALQFKQAYPANFAAYQKACHTGAVKIGEVFTVPTQSFANPTLKYIINFPTKQHWKGKSRIEDIESGLVSLIEEIRRLNIRSIALPPLGCGNGGLDWNAVRSRIEAAFADIPDVQALAFAPGNSPEPDALQIGTATPRLTKARALVLSLMKIWPFPEYRFSCLEMQKLAYFLQEVGEKSLHLAFVKAQYGPYAHNLKFVLQALEGHYLKGYGDGSQEAQMYLLPNAAKETSDFLASDAASQIYLKRVAQIIEGFEDPWGLELLATVHWAIKNDIRIVADPDEVIQAVHQWNERKSRVFKAEDVRMAWTHLSEVDALP